MKLEEIAKTRIPLKNSGVNFSDFLKKDEIGEISGNPVFKSISKSDPHVYLFFILNDKMKIAHVVAKDNIEIHGIQYLMLRRAWTEPHVRGQGFAIKLIKFIRDWTGKKLLSDKVHTSDGIKTWESLIKRFSVTALDINTGNKIDASEISHNELYKENPDDPGNIYFLVLENELSPVQRISRKYPISSKILKPYEF